MQSPDFFAFETRLLERLQARITVPGIKWFGSSDDAEAQRRAQFAPAIHVLYGGYRAAVGVSARQQQIDQSWIVLVSVKSAAGGGDRRDRAGLLLGQVLSALLGWPRPGKDSQFGPLRLASAPGVKYVGTVAHYPLSFTTFMPVEGQPEP